MAYEMPFGVDPVSVHRQSPVTESISCTLGNSVGAKVVTGVRGVLSLDDRTECEGNVHTTDESKEFGTRKSVLCHPRRPTNNQTRKGALIQREQEKKPYQGIDRDVVVAADQGLDPGLVAGVDQGADQGLDPGLVAGAVAGLPRPFVPKQIASAKVKDRS